MTKIIHPHQKTNGNALKYTHLRFNSMKLAANNPGLYSLHAVKFVSSLTTITVIGAADLIVSQERRSLHSLP